MHKSKDRQHNCQKTNNDLQNTTQKTKYRATRIPLKTGGVKVDLYCNIDTVALMKHIICLNAYSQYVNPKQIKIADNSEATCSVMVIILE